MGKESLPATDLSFSGEDTGMPGFALVSQNRRAQRVT